MITRAFVDIINGIVQAKLSNDSMRQIRSISDRVAYLENTVENMHQRVISLREAYNSSLSANLNETIRTLTLIATIILPLTLIAGIYGMNFDVMPEPPFALRILLCSIINGSISWNYGFIFQEKGMGLKQNLISMDF